MASSPVVALRSRGYLVRVRVRDRVRDRVRHRDRDRDRDRHRDRARGTVRLAPSRSRLTAGLLMSRSSEQLSPQSSAAY